ncbi:ATP-binding protein [Aestuariirhabdus litorea]|uniref:histidine kinase n=1 Tax=Aestuariirhabdus litorea TaxID=2528527 RepID=A0A3P3VMY3_9GAMM|nr:ATP-binding protein [Aestuariirhabdus litorea]RRJ84122.1 HAMP domain-containing protein [Aestuariirhabdus litorea]RWW97342.1 HAMP domain-containing protein [Endozoicomonadaceae bacterium GTF-13]
MTSIFLRIYGGLLFTLVLVAVLSGLAVTIINGVRLAEYRQEMAEGTFSLVAEELQRLPPGQRPEALARLELVLGIELVLLPHWESGLDHEQLDRAERQGVLVEIAPDNRGQIFMPLNDGMMLRAEINSLTEQLAYGTLQLLLERLYPLPPEARGGVLAELQVHRFGYALELVSPEQSQLSEPQLIRLAKGETLTQLGEGAGSVLFFSPLKDEPRLLKVGPVRLFELYPFKLLMSIVLFMSTSVSLAIYVLVRGLERRLRKLESAATHISRGNLDARVEVRGADSVGRLAMAFNGMASHIQRLLSIQKEMIRGVSHELRTPVARLRFGLEMVADATSESQRMRHLEGMDNDIQELDTLVDEILTYANLEQGSPVIHFRREDIDGILDQVTREQSQTNPDIQIEHRRSQLPEMMRKAEVERRYMHRAVQNLVGNACRYARGRVRVSYHLNAENCRIDVEDDGPGIPEEQWERVFTPFTRLDDSRTRASGGYGLGLSIVRRIVYWHNGRALVGHSDLGGARFSIVWPRKQRR